MLVGYLLLLLCLSFVIIDRLSTSTSSYWSWWMRYRIGRLLPRFTSSYWWKDTFYYNPKNFLFKLWFGFDSYVRWGISGYLSNQFLRVSYWMGQHTHGYPVGLSADGPINIRKVSGFQEDEEAKAEDEKNIKTWAEIINKIRFAHFYMLFIENDEFGWMIETPEDRKNCLKWARKKYWYVREFLTDEWWNSMYTDESLKYSSEMHFGEIDPETDCVSLTFIDTNKETGEVVEDLPYETKYPHVAVAKEMKSQFEEGMELFKTYYQNLWD